MPDLLAMPREIRDLIYTAYFESVLQEDADTLLLGLPLLRSSRGVAIEATEAAISTTTASLTASRNELEALRSRLSGSRAGDNSRDAEAVTEQKQRKQSNGTGEWGVLLEWARVDSRLKGQEGVAEGLQRRLGMLVRERE